ncbi:unnamed protein product, partial [Brassica rapa]
PSSPICLKFCGSVSLQCKAVREDLRLRRYFFYLWLLGEVWKSLPGTQDR